MDLHIYIFEDLRSIFKLIEDTKWLNPCEFICNAHRYLVLRAEERNAGYKRHHSGGELCMYGKILYHPTNCKPPSFYIGTESYVPTVPTYKILRNFLSLPFCVLIYLKGTVSRDFLYPVFFINQFILVPLEMSMGRFIFFLIFHRVIALLKRLPGTLETGESP